MGCNGFNDDCFDMTDPGCVNYDFCVAQGELTADFEVFKFRATNPFENGEIVRIENIIADTTYPGRISFRAVGEDATSYDWTVGTAPRFIDTREWELPFREATGSVAISLAVEREISRCPERGLETKSFSKEIFVLPNKLDFPVPYVGKYIGNNESEPNSLEFEIEFFLVDPNEGNIKIRNFPRNAINRGDFDNLGIVADYKSFIIAPTTNICCRRAHGTGRFSDNRKELRIAYSTYNFEREEWEEDVWTGIRVE
jgi:hypothetical protein